MHEVSVRSASSSMFALASGVWIISMLWLTRVANGSLINERFWQFRFSSDVARDEQIFTANASTASACGNLCTGFPTCQSFGFNSGSHTCWLHDHLVLYTTNGAAAPGTRYFWRLFPRCPTELGYTLEEGLCFKVHRVNMTFLEARDVCAEEGGTLFIGDTVEKMDVLKNHVVDRTWVGGSDPGVQGDWRWEDGGRLDITSPLWNPGSPDNYGGQQERLFIKAAGRVDDRYGGRENHFACQISLL